MKLLLLCVLVSFVKIGNAFVDQQFPLQSQNFEVASPSSECLESDLTNYADGMVDFKTFSASCFKKINERRYNPPKLMVLNAHIVKDDVISQLKWRIVVYLSGTATSSLSLLPWSRLGRLEHLALDFQALNGAASFPASLVEKFPKSISSLGVFASPSHFVTIKRIFARYGGTIRFLSMGGSLTSSDFAEIPASFQGNSNPLNVGFYRINENDCTNYFNLAFGIGNTASGFLERLNIECSSYNVASLEDILDTVRVSQTTQFVFGTGFDKIVKWMKKMIEVGDVANRRKASVVMVESGSKGSAFISFKSIQQPAFPKDNEVKRAWLEDMVSRAEQYSAEPELLRIFQFLYHGYYGPVRGIDKLQIDEFLKFREAHPI